jgi:hypothetical protein
MKRKALLAASLLLVTMLFLNGCAPKKTPYELNNQDHYCVSIKYDANGGLFTDNTTVIMDSYNISDLATNSQGQVEIALLPPDASVRGTDAFAPRNNGYFLAAGILSVMRLPMKQEMLPILIMGNGTLRQIF